MPFKGPQLALSIASSTTEKKGQCQVCRDGFRGSRTSSNTIDSLLDGACVENTLFDPYNNGAPLASLSRTPLFTHQNNKTRMETMTHGKLIIPIIAGIFCSDARRYLFLLTINVSKVSIHAYSHIDRSVSVADFVQKEVGYKIRTI